MLGPTEIVLIYYLGFGFVILLGWAACHPDRLLDTDGARRYLRRAALAAVAGIVHPAIALAARDLIGQVGHELPTGQDIATTHRRVATTANACAVLSLVPAGALVAMNLT